VLDLGMTFLQSIERDPSKTAVVFDGQRLSYESWGQQVGALQDYLKSVGIKRGDRILTILQNRYEAATIHWACQVSGVTIVPVNWRSKPDEIDFFVENADVKFAFVEQISLENLLASTCVKTLPYAVCGAIESPVNTDQFSDIVATGRDISPQATVEDWSVMLYTSGTTGRPKGVPRRHRAERAAALAHIAQNQYRMNEVTIGVMPLYHTMGVRSLLTLCMLNGTYIAFPRWNPDQFITAIERERVTHLYLVPTLYHDILNSQEFDVRRVRSVKKLGFAGAPMNDGLLLKLQEAFIPDLFVNHYGSSEIYTYSINQTAVLKPGSAGRAAFNARIRVVRFDSDSKLSSADDICDPLEEGQIICDLAGDEAFEGYWKRPEVDRKSIRNGWFFTSDTGYYDTDGELYVTGRVDDLIISGGENISPVEIESALSLHPAVDEVAVVGLPDERLGKKVVAFIKSKELAVNTEQLDAHCKDSDLANFKRPREYVFVREIPKSPVGKILRRKLVAGEFERV
jgi:2-furoate---CoA ligase